MEYENEHIFSYKTGSAGYCPCVEGMRNSAYCASKERCDGTYSIPQGLPVLGVTKKSQIIIQERTIESLILN